jgi:hypothetical protein
MHRTRLTNLLLLVIAIALVVIAARPYIAPPPALAQSATAYPFHIEPGVQMLRAPDGSRQVLGRVVIDMRDGRVWGFPTNAHNPWPTNATQTKPVTSVPFELGRFAFDDVK